MLDAVREHKPDVILGHSLGSLVTYNAFSHGDAQEAEVRALLAKAYYVTAGSQIGNPFVMKNLTNGRVLPLPVRFWHHLYNVHDSVFTAPIRLWEATNFRQTDTPFDEEGIADHTAESYLGHSATSQNVWARIGREETGCAGIRPGVQHPNPGDPQTSQGAARVAEVDAKLVALAKARSRVILTNDFNLNRVAELQGVRVMNINSLANAVKPAVLPGEELRVRVIQEGKEPGQGVGFLDDGTMIVVEGGSRHIDRDLDVSVTRVLQTVAGRMIFAQPRLD